MRRGIALLLVAGMGLSVILAAGVSFYASSEPDGLEAVAQDEGFADTGRDSAAADSPFADYGVSGVEQGRWSVGLAGVTGVLLTAAVGFLLFRILAGRKGETVPVDADADARGGG